MGSLFSTDRLNIRHYDPEADAAAAFRIYSDPEVMRFLGRQPHVMESLEQQRERLAAVNALSAERGDGSLMAAIALKATGDVVGSVLLKPLVDADREPTPDWEVGWHLRRDVWGNGYATEAALGALEYGFGKLALPVIYAIAYKENAASLRVMDRLGMTYLGATERYYGVCAELYEKRADV